MNETATAARAQPWSADPAVRAVVALGFSQIIAWGTTLYMPGVIGRAMAADLGWSPTTIFGGLTVGLLVAASVSTFVGRQIDQRGARGVMTGGAILAATSLAALAFVSAQWAYLAIWAALGLAMRLTLYDAAFPALVQVTPSRGRRAISFVTLFGGLASSIFWPIGFWIEARYGWRTTLLVFAVLNLCCTAPLNWFGLARREATSDTAQCGTPTGAAATTTDAAAPILAGRSRAIAMALFAVVMVFSAYIFGAMAAHLVPLIEAAGVGAAVAVGLASLKGVAQVAGRLWEILFAKNWSAITVGRISIAILPISFVLLLLGGTGLTSALAFTLAFGVTNGLTTIVRGSVPLALFGPQGYGAILGLLATPYLVMNAIAPSAYALIIEQFGAQAGPWTLFGAGLCAMAAMEILALWYRRLSARA